MSGGPGAVGSTTCMPGQFLKAFGYPTPGNAGNAILATISDTAPLNPVPGNFWFDSVGVQLYVYYQDINSAQWVPANNLVTAGLYLALSGGTMTGPAALVGITNGSNALAGQVGEFLSAVQTTAVAIGSVTTNITSLILTAGDWDISGEVWALPTGPQSSFIAVGINSVSATLPSSPAVGTSYSSLHFNSAIIAGYIVGLSGARVSLTASATYYLVGMCNDQTINFYGKITARRMR